MKQTETSGPVLTVAEIREAHKALMMAFDCEMINWGDRLYKLCLEEEMGHRHWGPDFDAHHTPDTINERDAARLFSVLRVAQYLTGDTLPEIKDYLHMQKSCYMAAAMALEFGEKIRKEWAKFSIPDLAKLNYTNYVKVNQ